MAVSNKKQPLSPAKHTHTRTHARTHARYLKGRQNVSRTKIFKVGSTFEGGTGIPGETGNHIQMRCLIFGPGTLVFFAFKTCLLLVLF